MDLDPDAGLDPAGRPAAGEIGGGDAAGTGDDEQQGDDGYDGTRCWLLLAASVDGGK